MASTVKRSITLDEDLDRQLVERFPPGERSRFINDAARVALAQLRFRELIGVLQALARGTGERAVERLVRDALETAGLDMLRARTAAHLLRDSRTTDVADALVCGEALLRIPSVLITSDPGDMRRLLDTDPRGAGVAVWAL